MTKTDQKIPDKDLKLLKSIGFDVKLSIGSGEFGSVYCGVYEHIASGIRDSEGQLLDVVVGNKFAIKYIDIKRNEELELRNGRIERMESIRRYIENRKRLRNLLLNSDLLQFKFCLNLGEYQTICLNTRSQPKSVLLKDIDLRPSYDRLYLIMDFSEIGNLDKYLLKIASNGLTVTEIEANILCKRLLSAVVYLHKSKVFGLNIKPNNILIFEEYIPSDNKTYVVPKLSDFLINNCLDEPNEEIATRSSSAEEETSGTESMIQLSEMKDIYLLAEIFDKIISNTSFKTEFNQNLIQDLIESMKQFQQKSCEQFNRDFNFIFDLFN